MKTRPPRVVIDPPEKGTSIGRGSIVGIPSEPVSRAIPNGWLQITRPLDRSTADISPQGGGLHGDPSNDRNGSFKAG